MREKNLTVDNGVEYDKALEKETTVDNDGVECDKVRDNALPIDDNGVRRDNMIEKKSKVDDNSVRSTNLGRSGLRGICSSLRCERHPQRR